MNAPAAPFSFAAITDKAPAGAQLFTLYGPPKIGKTSFIATIPKLFIIAAEDGLTNITTPPPHFPRPPRTMAEFGLALDAFAAGNRTERRFNHLAIDSLSWVEVLVHQAARAAVRRKNLDDDYKVGWGEVAGVWDELFVRLAALRRQAGCHVWLVAHGVQRPESNAAGDTWQKWDVDVDKKAAPLVRKISDHVLFANFGAQLRKGKGKKTVGEYTGRLLYFRESADHFAGSRSNAPEVTPLDWARVEQVLTAGAPAPADKMRAAIAAIMPELPDADRADIERRLAAAKDGRALAQVLAAAQACQAAAQAEAGEDGEAPTAPPVEPAAPPVAAAPALPAAPPRAAPPPPDDDEELSAAPLGAGQVAPQLPPPAPPEEELTDEQKARRAVDGAGPDAKSRGLAAIEISKLALPGDVRKRFVEELAAKGRPA
jgi:hypothetical protein